MNSTPKYSLKTIISFTLLICLLSCNKTSNDYSSEVIKIALRDVGHELLLANQDSTSLVKPVIKIDNLKYQLSFNSELSIHPESLVSLIKNSFQKTNLPSHYLTEVIQCKDNEVAYSYEMKLSIDKGIIPCVGRQLPKGCYTIQVRFKESLSSPNNNFGFLYFLAFGVLLLLAFVLYKKRNAAIPEVNDVNVSSIGHFKFYPEQNKLIKEATEISLSKKECELLAIFVENPNQIIKRDVLTKKVWEDHGVIVGRSLDTYISKLRKKLQGDDSIKITNVHGVGYKLEVL